MSLQSEILSDLSAIATDLDNPVITWNSQDYEVIPSSTSKGLLLEMGGLAGESTLVFTIRKDLFTDDIYPSSKQTLVYNSNTYRIEAQRQDPTGAFIRLFCVDNNRGV